MLVIAANGQSPSGLAGSASSPVRGAFLRGLRPLALTYSLYFLITKHGSGAVCAQFANSQTSTV